MVITLNREPLRYDVEQLTYRYAEPRLDKPETKDMAQMDDNTSDANLITRYISTGVAKLRIVMKQWLERSDEAANDNLSTDTSWTFETTSDVETDSQALADLMHWFIVRYAVSEWTRMFAPSETAGAKADLDDALTDLTDALKGGDMPVKERRDISNPDVYNVVATYSE